MYDINNDLELDELAENVILRSAKRGAIKGGLAGVGAGGIAELGNDTDAPSIKDSLTPQAMSGMAMRVAFGGGKLLLAGGAIGAIAGGAFGAIKTTLGIRKLRSEIKSCLDNKLINNTQYLSMLELIKTYVSSKDDAVSKQALNKLKTMLMPLKQKLESIRRKAEVYKALQK